MTPVALTLGASVLVVAGWAMYWSWFRAVDPGGPTPGFLAAQPHEASDDPPAGDGEALPDPIAAAPPPQENTDTPSPSPIEVNAAEDEVLRPSDGRIEQADDDSAEATPEPAAPPAPDDTHAASDRGGSASSGNHDIAAARRLYDQGHLVQARQRLNELLRRNLSPVERQETRGLLTKIADDTIFSKNRHDGDPLVDIYEVHSGDALERIGRRFKVPHEIIMTINGITDARRLRAGQKLKIPRGPFHAVIDKSDFRLDLFLQDTYVRSYRVGLGLNHGTPEGKWKVGERLVNPTFYPPASAEQKRIIPGGDPTNPLGKRWIELIGVSGDADGQQGYGIHGTIEPESIGKAVSLGCVRMHNDDVAFLYSVLAREHSTVITQP